MRYVKGGPCTSLFSEPFPLRTVPFFILVPKMAHYANDCWDGEIETSFGWVECVGLADRSAYDLTAHAKMSKIELTAHEKFAEPRMVDLLKVCSC